MIKIKNWSSHQSYKDRKPPWIRFHRSMLDNYKYQTMSADSRALLPMLWLLACEDDDPTSGLIRASYEEITFRLRLCNDTVTKCVQEIQEAGFIECIETVKNRNETVTPETETEAETETETESRCPHIEIINLYNEILKNLPKVKVNIWGGERKKDLKARWETDKEFQSIKFWEDFFLKVSRSDFLMGRNGRDGKHKNWKPDIGWMLKLNNFSKIIEGKYDNNDYESPNGYNPFMGVK